MIFSLKNITLKIFIMEKITDLKELLKHEIIDLYSAEQQIIEALPIMIEKAGNEDLKNTLQRHLEITEDQKTRLEEIQQMMTQAEEEVTGDEQSAEEDGEQKAGSDGSRKGFFSRLFGGKNDEKCKGMEGLINEGNKMMNEDLSPEVADAAIIASAQKIEHYEISGYGTARAYARELKLDDIAGKLEQTLNEEYEADRLLTELAVGDINLEAEFAEPSGNGDGRSKSAAKKSGAKGGNVAATKGNSNNRTKSAAKSGSKAAPKKGASAFKSSSSKGASKNSASKKGASSNNRNAASKGASKGGNNSSSKKSGSKKSASKNSSASKGKSGSKGKSSRGR